MYSIAIKMYYPARKFHRYNYSFYSRLLVKGIASTARPDTRPHANLEFSLTISRKFCILLIWFWRGRTNKKGRMKNWKFKNIIMDVTTVIFALGLFANSHFLCCIIIITVIIIQYQRVILLCGHARMCAHMFLTTLIILHYNDRVYELL